MRIGLAGAGRIGARHARTLTALPQVEALLIADADPARAHALAAHLADAPPRPAPSPQATPDAATTPGSRAVPGEAGAGEPLMAGPGSAGCEVGALGAVAELFAARVDAVVVAASTDVHAELALRAIDARLPVFCEKPLAVDAYGTFQIHRAALTTGVPVQVGFQRRFDPGYAALREAVAAGRLGWLHSLRSCSYDPAPPPREYVPTSGGIYRDCLIHDLDAIRFVTGREIDEVYAAGSNKGEEFFAAAGDVDTGAALLTLDDGTLAQIVATRYNAAGYDVRLEVCGAKDSMAAGLDARTPLTSDHTPADPYSGFLDRFAGAYEAELRTFVTDVVPGRIESPCPPAEALAALWAAEACELSRREHRPVRVAELSEEMA